MTLEQHPDVVWFREGGRPGTDGSGSSVDGAGVPGGLRLKAIDLHKPFPELGPGTLIGWIHTRRVLSQEAAVLGLEGRLYYLAPSGGLTLGQYFLARRAGAVPVSGELIVRDDAVILMKQAHGGQILVVTLDRGAAEDSRLLAALLEQLDGEGLSVEPVRDLIGDMSPVGVRTTPAGT